VTYSAQFLAYAPNAGGQQAYSLRRADDKGEWSVFANTYLMTGAFPLSGMTYNWRFPICNQSCFWQFFVEAGAGVSTAGPMVEVVWGSILLWSLRVDLSTQAFLIPQRVILWSYPFWMGVSLPL
jgi:hypothetical protein